MPKRRIIDKYNENFFKDEGVHNKTIGHVQGHMQAQAELHDYKKLSEAFFAQAMENVVKSWSNRISRSITVIPNETYAKFNKTRSSFRTHFIRIKSNRTVILTITKQN